MSTDFLLEHPEDISGTNPTVFSGKDPFMHEIDYFQSQPEEFFLFKKFPESNQPPKRLNLDNFLMMLFAGVIVVVVANGIET
jgi:hypothetical protein